MPEPLMIAVMGPTASGKSRLAIDLAAHYHTSVLSFDSRQFYEGADIGTAKPTGQELAEVPHHLISQLKIDENYSAADFERDALGIAERTFQNHNVMLAAGGTGFYLRILEKGLDDMPEVDDVTRNEAREIFATRGLQGLQEEVQRRDHRYFASCDVSNHVRLLRALELMLASGKKVSELRAGSSKQRTFRILKIMRGDFTDSFRSEVYGNIEKRVHAMWSAGLLDEARRLQKYRECQSMQTVGYRECFDFLDGKISESECLAQIIMHTRQYAKRQFTWLRKEKGLRLFPGATTESIISEIDKELKEARA